jgi:putative glycosyltransferase (TIGR04348 family)
LKINLITPAKKHSKNGNMSTALRWAQILRDQGHSVHVDNAYNGNEYDLMIAIHAWRSAASITDFKTRFPEKPLIAALGGTDVNTFLKTDPEPTLKSMDMADALVCLNSTIRKALPKHLHSKLHIIHQSAKPLLRARSPRKRTFGVCVIGHLREEKDPFRTARASRFLPASSKLKVRHLGKAHSIKWAAQAESEMAKSPRYNWIGEVAGWQVRQEYAKTHLMVISSNQEGGANVVSEAIVAGVPIIASKIDGNVGLLGENYPGYYPVRDERELANLLIRAETEADFLASLQTHCDQLRPLFTPASEAAAWRDLFSQVTK